ncbi:T9SS type B sorting domain-containing protein [Roseivirga pacifica]|uniref:T9SS type B sorting domain-containing protein n=1 Tax=Roseivirga pacifica TaxID=1267423 RepID=UPI002095A1B2|nr:gliding motility-associated C-terminal domain-containing protein [Roseivirga pacifica]MCO6358246.1 T9SS type B sorting domain-containing protein [Roseivirga pacifica]MCO6366290.1 T9SS type B sorting domain-containing protein [Roseivirga pacifica]MCO6373977.1 T9SS type B sorting domain-containing protein [Roseivirga pacifica]MCO6378353.1 T9SS type B sorting domain-containing protein [Roseivirga pacifica]
MRNNHILLSLLFTLVCFAGYGQDYTRHNWHFSGNDRALVFGKETDTEAIIDLGKQAQNNIGEKLTVTDPTSGDLIFYSDGVNIFDATHQIMPNGNRIFSDANGIQAMASSPVPGPASIGLYYIFHRDASGQVFYTIVNANTQGNRPAGPPSGAVVASQKNQPTGIMTRGDGMLVIPSADMQTFWLVTQQAGGGMFEIFEIPQQGGIFNSVGVLNLTNSITAAHLAFHPATGQIAVTPSSESNIQILQFNEAAPFLSPGRAILNSFAFGETFGGSAGWSFSGDHLYFSRNSGSDGSLYRFNLADTSSTVAVQEVLDAPVAESLSLLLAPDSTIYHLYKETASGSTLLSRIDQADSALNLVNYESALFDGADFNSDYFANFSPHEGIMPVIEAFVSEDPLCMNNPVQFYAIFTPSTAIPTSFQWDFQPQGIISNQQSPIMTFEEAGPVMASVTVEINGRTYNSNVVTANIEQNDLQVSLPDTTICPGETLELDAEPQQGGQGQQGGATGGPYTYLWSTGETTSSIEVDEAGDYWVVVTPQTGCPVYGTGRVQIYGEENNVANIWYFGNGAGIDFNEEEGLPDPPRSIDSPHAMNAPAGTSTISDANGDVLFYSDGNTVWNREHGEMPNGTEIGGDTLSTNSVIIIPFVDDETLYYLFTTEQVYGDNTFELKYSVVDMKEDDGRGDVVLKDVVLYSKATEKLAAFEGGNGFWLMSHEYGNNTFRAYPITGEGIGAPVLSSAGRVHSFNDPLSGQAGMKFSADGARIATALIEGTEDYIEVFEFDQTTGEVTELAFDFDLNEGDPGNDEVYDVHFSNGGNKIFATMNQRNGGSPGGRIIEYRIDSASTETTRLDSRAVISTNSGLNVNFGQIQTGPDGQLYVAVETPGNPAGSAFVSSIIANEDTASVSSLNPQAVALTTGYSRLGLPNFVQNMASPLEEPSMSAPELVCVEERVELAGTGTSDIDVFNWSITSQDDNSTVFSAEGQDTAYVFPQGQSGLFNISLNISNRCGFDTTLVQAIEVHDIPAPPTVPQAVSVCEGETTSLDAIEGEPDNPDLSFEWTDSQGNVVSTTRNFEITTPEIYTVTVTNIAGCSSSAEIFAGPPFEIELPDDQVICQDASLTLDPQVNADNYQWTIINPDNSTTLLPNQRTATVDSSTPGVYQYVVSIEDPITPGCFVNDTTQVTVNPLAQIILNSTTDEACGASDGAFEFSISSTGSYSYVVTGTSSGQVDSGSTTGPAGPITVSGLAADVYAVQVTDNAAGCSNTFNDIQINSDSPGFSIVNATPSDATCNSPTGSILVELDTDVFPIDFTLSPTSGGSPVTGTGVTAITGTTNFEISGVSEGTYTLQVTSNASCTESFANDISVDQPDDIDDLVINGATEICSPNPQTTLIASSSNGNSYTYSWTTPSGGTQTGPSITATESGTYAVTADGAGFCPGTETVDVILTVQPVVDIVVDGDPCEGQVNLEANITNTQPNTNYIYNWVNNAGESVGNTRVITVNESDTYNVTVRAEGDLTCPATANETVTIPEELEATVSSTPACDDGSPIELSVDILSGNPTSISWTRDGQQVGTSQPGQPFVVNDEGAYTATISDGICSIERSINITRQRIPEGELPDVDYYCSTRSDNPVLLAGQGFASYEWTLDGAPYPQGGQYLTVDGPGEYVVTMTTAIGCVRTDTVLIIESCDPKIIAPNAFAPTSPAPNNTFSVFPNDFVDQFEIFIYSRWGELIYQSNLLDFKWDGTFNGELVPLGTYPYVLRFTSRFEPEKGTFEQHGAVTVIR